jgi:preprotein translocase subunit YajC
MIDWVTVLAVSIYYVVVIRPDVKRRAQERQENLRRWN